MKFSTGHVPWNKGLTKEENEIIRRISEILKTKLKGKHLPQETRQKISEKLKLAHTRKSWGFLRNDLRTIEVARKGGKNSPMKFKKGASIINTGRTRFKKGEYRVINNPFHFRPSHPRPQNAFSFPKGNQYAKGRKKSPKAYSFPEGNPYRFKAGVRSNPEGEFKVGDQRHSNAAIQMKRLRNIIKKPNKQEAALNKFLQTNFPNEFRYAGNGAFMVGSKCPDFVSTNEKKKVIEVFGAYWHDQERRKLLSHQTVSGTIGYYRNHGFECLVVWENELRNPADLFTKIKDFIKDG